MIPRSAHPIFGTPHVLAAPSAAEALQLAQNLDRPIDLLLTDVVMPGMNGRELAERLAAAHPNLRVLFTSGYPADTVVRHGIAAARTAFIEKPYLPTRPQSPRTALSPG